MRTDWVLNDDGVLDGGSDWFRGIWETSEMKKLTIGKVYPKYELPLLKLKTDHINWLFHSHEGLSI